MSRSALVPTIPVALGRFTELAGRLLEAPVVCVSLVDTDRRLWTSGYGLSAPAALLVFWSFIQQVIASGRPLVVCDGRRHSLAARNPAVRDGTVTAYVGMPLVGANGRAVGTLSVMDHKPRRWSASQLRLLRKLSAWIVRAVDLEPRVRPLPYIRKENHANASGLLDSDPAPRCSAPRCIRRATEL